MYWFFEACVMVQPIDMNNIKNYLSLEQKSKVDCAFCNLIVCKNKNGKNILGRRRLETLSFEVFKVWQSDDISAYKNWLSKKTL